MEDKKRNLQFSKTRQRKCFDRLIIVSRSSPNLWLSLCFRRTGRYQDLLIRGAPLMTSTAAEASRCGSCFLPVILVVVRLVGKPH
jgi:hypothetical protein